MNETSCFFFMIFVMTVILTACGGNKENLQTTAGPTDVPALSGSTADAPSGEETVIPDVNAAETAQEPKPGEENLGQYRVQAVDGVITIPTFGIKVTMLNVWGIDCGPCILEMPSLMKLYQKYQDQGFMIIGLTSDIMDMSDGIDPRLAEDAKGIIADLKIEYPILSMTRENYDRMHIVGTPTTYFVDSAGNIIGNPILGSKTEGEWERLITDALAVQN